MSKRKIMLLAAALVMVAVLGIGGTLAYFTDKDEEINTFTVGNVDIDLTEPGWDPDLGGTGEEEAKDVYPGEPLAKDPTIENIGKNPCFVRISVSNLDQFVAEYGEDAMIGLRYQYVDGYNTNDWVLHTDGYYYYCPFINDTDRSGVLAIGVKTNPVFDQIVIPYALTNNEATTPIEVKAEAVQAQGAKASFSAVQAMTVEEIAAWFTTCGF